MRALTIFALTCAILGSAQAEQPKGRTWGELSQEVQLDWTLRLVLPDATVIQGQRASFTPDALTLQVLKTSNAAQHPKGQVTIPREQVKTLGIRKSGIKFRTIGALAPVAAGTAAAGMIASDKHLESAVAGAVVFLSVAVAGGTAGFFIGRAADRSFHTVTVKP